MMNYSQLFHVLLVLLATSVSGHVSRRKAHAQKLATGTRRNVDSARDWDRGIMAFRETVVRDFLEGDISATRIANGSAVTWLLTILQNPGQNGKSEWDQLEEHKNKEITENAEDNSVRKLLIGFNKIVRLMGKAQERTFTKSDLDVIRAVWQNFFPQAFSDITFTIKWLDALTKYLTILAAGYIDLMKAGAYDECKLAEQLNMFKPQIIDAAKMLAKARYKSLDKVSWSGGADRFKTTATLTMWDEVTGKLFDDIPLTQLAGRLFTPMKEHMADFIMKNLVYKFNALYNGTWGSYSCTLENQIIVQDIEVEYPDECMDTEGICILPCGYYMESKTWCPTKLKGNRWKSTRNEKYWDDCKPPDWDKCMFVPQLKATVWSDEYEKLKGEKLKEEKARDEIVSLNNETSIDVNKENTNELLNNTSLIYDGITAITSLLGDGIGDNNTLAADEKQELNAEIARKVKKYLTEENVDENASDDGKHKRNGVNEKGMGNVVEALIVKAVLDKKRNGNIRSYLDGLNKWEIKSDYMKRAKNKKDTIGSKYRDKLEKKTLSP